MQQVTKSPPVMVKYTNAKSGHTLDGVHNTILLLRMDLTLGMKFRMAEEIITKTTITAHQLVLSGLYNHPTKLEIVPLAMDKLTSVKIGHTLVGAHNTIPQVFMDTWLGT